MTTCCYPPSGTPRYIARSRDAIACTAAHVSCIGSAVRSALCSILIEINDISTIIQAPATHCTSGTKVKCVSDSYACFCACFLLIVCACGEASTWKWVVCCVLRQHVIDRVYKTSQIQSYRWSEIWCDIDFMIIQQQKTHSVNIICNSNFVGILS